MKSRGIAFDSDVSVGTEPAAAVLEDRSRFKNNGTITNATWTRLPSGLWVLSFDGNDYLKNATANWRSSDSAGAIEVWFKTSLANGQVLFASDDEGTSTHGLVVYITNATGELHVFQQNADTGDDVKGTTNVCDGVWHHAVISTNGVSATTEANHATDGYKIILDGVRETCSIATGANTGDWFAETTLRDNIVIGARNHTTIVSYMTGEIGYTIIYSSAITVATALSNFNQEKHLFGR